MKIQLKFYGENPEPVLDRLPTARIVEEKEHQFTISAEVYGKGILMWLLSQGSRIEVIRPESLRQEMKKKVEEILKLYSQCINRGIEMIYDSHEKNRKAEG